MSIGQRIKKVRKERGWSQAKLAAEASKYAGNQINQSVIGKLESKAEANSVYIPHIARALGVSALWLSSGVGVQKANPDEPQPVHNAAEATTKIPSVADLGEEFALLPVAEVKEGKLVIQASPGFPVRRYALEDAEVEEEDGLIVRILGDTMEDFLYAGDYVIVDRTDRAIVHGRVYALLWGGELMVRRLKRDPGGIRICHANAAYEDIRLEQAAWDSNVMLLGRVKHKGGSGGL